MIREARNLSNLIRKARVPEVSTTGKVSSGATSKAESALIFRFCMQSLYRSSAIRRKIRGIAHAQGTIEEVSRKGVAMSNDAAKSFPDFPQAEVDHRDPQSIADLIEILDQDLAETQKLSSERH
jgi:hypothetical protein